MTTTMTDEKARKLILRSIKDLGYNTQYCHNTCRAFLKWAVARMSAAEIDQMLQSGDDINLSELEQELRGVKADFGP